MKKSNYVEKEIMIYEDNEFLINCLNTYMAHGKIVLCHCGRRKCEDCEIHEKENN